MASIAVSVKGMNQHGYAMQIFQGQGTVLSGVYLVDATKLTGKDVAALKVMVVATEKRLAASFKE